jgi:hypothetical protein
VIRHVPVALLVTLVAAACGSHQNAVPAPSASPSASGTRPAFLTPSINPTPQAGDPDPYLICTLTTADGLAEIRVYKSTQAACAQLPSALAANPNGTFALSKALLRLPPTVCEYTYGFEEIAVSADALSNPSAQFACDTFARAGMNRVPSPQYGGPSDLASQPSPEPEPGDSTGHLGY